MDEAENELIDGLKCGDKQAANALISIYFPRVVAAARKRLEGLALRSSSEDDIAASVFESLWKKAQRNDFGEEDLNSPEEFWRLLCTMTRFKARDHSRRERAERRGGGKVRGESAFANQLGENAGIAEFAVDANSAEKEISFREQHELLMSKLSDKTLVEIVTLRLEGFKVREIAARFDKSERWVKRKLALIREYWSFKTQS